MSDHFPAEIYIGGPIPRVLLEELVGVIVADGASLEDYGAPCATEEDLRKAFREGAVVSLYDAEASFGQFDGLEAFLVKHRIPFDRYSDAFYEYNAEAVFYRGRGEPIIMPTDQEGHVMVHAEVIAKVLDDGSLDAPRKLNAVRRLIAPPGTEPLAPIRFVDALRPKRRIRHA
ncbi:MAG TPA: hypothetical protein VNA25_16605 [Phycisphaerae bacterium]|nr:hypothetical protein [Phycisphaerae bacterium]